MLIVHTGLPSLTAPTPAPGLGPREEAENRGPGRSAHTPGLEGVTAQFCSPPGGHPSQLLGSFVHSPGISRTSPHALWGRERQRCHPGRRPPGTGVSGGDHSQADGERRPRGTGLDCSASSSDRRPTQRASWGPGTRPRSWQSAGVRACRGRTEPTGVQGGRTEPAGVRGGRTEPLGSGGTAMLPRPPSSDCERPGNKDVPLAAGGEHPLSGAPAP